MYASAHYCYAAPEHFRSGLDWNDLSPFFHPYYFNQIAPGLFGFELRGNLIDGKVYENPIV